MSLIEFLRAALFQYGYGWQYFAFHKLQEGPTAGGNIRDLVSYAVFVNGSHGVATAGQ